MLIVADFDNQAFIIRRVKKLVVVLIAAFSIITACMIYLIREGVSLRLGRVIEPTLISLGETEISRGVVSRLTPVFAEAKYVVFGIDKEDPQVQKFLESLQGQYKNAFKDAPQLVNLESQTLEQCKSRCWVISVPGESSHLQASDLLTKIELTGEKYFTISILRFDRSIEVPKHCETEKRITIDCVTPLAVREARRKFKTESAYFFARSYNDKDYFFFMEQ